MLKAAFFATVFGVLVAWSIRVEGTSTVYGDCAKPSSSAPHDKTNDASPPQLTWCRYTNPYILSDFLSRNGTELTVTEESSQSPSTSRTSGSNASSAVTTTSMPTASRNATMTATASIPPAPTHPAPTRTTTNRSDEFNLNVWCLDSAGSTGANGSRFPIGALAGGEDAPSPTNASIRRSCGAIREIRGATYANTTSVTRLIMFTDSDGQMLFLDFNDNRMVSSLTIGVPQVTHFDATQAITTNASGSPIRQDVVFLVGNATLVAVGVIEGDTGTMTPPCVVMNYPGAVEDGTVLVIVTFDLPASLTGGDGAIEINLVYSWQYNYTKLQLLSGMPASQIQPWMNLLYAYELAFVPSPQHTIAAYIAACQGSAPAQRQLLLHFRTLQRPAKILIKRNLISNTTFAILHTVQAVVVFVATYWGAANVTASSGSSPSFTYLADTGLVVDWCVNQTLYNPETGGTKVYPRSRATVFCVPAGYRITAVDAYFLPPFSSASNASTSSASQSNPIVSSEPDVDPKVLWLVIALAADDAAYEQLNRPYLHVMPLTELALFPQRNNSFRDGPEAAPTAQPSTATNPLALASTFGTPDFPCDFDTEWFDTREANRTSAANASSCATGWRTTVSTIPYTPVVNTTAYVELTTVGCCRTRRVFHLPLSQPAAVSRMQSRTVMPLSIVDDSSFDSDAFGGAEGPATPREAERNAALKRVIGIVEEPYVAIFIAQGRVITVATALFEATTVNVSGPSGSFLLSENHETSVNHAPPARLLASMPNVPGDASVSVPLSRVSGVAGAPAVVVPSAPTARLFDDHNSSWLPTNETNATTMTTLGVVLQPANEIVYLGSIDYFFVSDNGQHLLAAVRRGEWELLSQQRYERICQRIAGDAAAANGAATSTGASANVFLQPAFGAACAAQAPEPINLNSFAQYSSLCSYSTLCPSLSQPLVALPSAGYYADRPAVRRECPAGSFCALGQKTQCPPGFYCNASGMSAPTRCALSTNYSETCASWGQTAPQPCPNGTVCLAPHIPGFPAPPGFMVPAAALVDQAPSSTLRMDFVPCPDGAWCPLGTQQPPFVTTNSSGPNATSAANGSSLEPWRQWCPSNSFCPDPAVISPTLCVCDAAGNITYYDTYDDGNTSRSSATNGTTTVSLAQAPAAAAAGGGQREPTLINVDCHARTLFCPVATVNVTWCPAGFYCTMPNVSVPCVATQYCPEGTFAPALCPSGTYCDSPNSSVTCPEGSYCPTGSVVPIACNLLVYCPSGSADQSLSFIAPTTLICVVLGVLIGFYAYARYDRRRQLNAQQAAASMSPTVRNFLKGQGALPSSPRLKPSSPRQPVASATSVEGSVQSDHEAATAGDAVRPSDHGTSTADEDDVNLDDPSLNQELLSAESQLDAMRDLVPTSTFATPTIEFRGMGLTLAKGECKGKVVLDNVTGVIKPGSFVAVMGPSGSGKSTFMHTLAGKAFYGHRSGHVIVNGDEVDLIRLAKVVGFVKQDDIMHREMTVFETLLFNARMRFDATNCMESPESIANATMKVLDLNHVRDTAIGDEKKRGISGGQRKRVNIGMEMAALPSILFLDEPTSGLDSSSSMTVCAALRAMADAGITIIAVIHQPRYEIFTMFHQVMLLAKGGKLVFFDEPRKALPYFENVLRVMCPPHVNPPDFFMDTISGEALPFSTHAPSDAAGSADVAGVAASSASRMTIDDMARLWQQHAASSDTVAREETTATTGADRAPVAVVSSFERHDASTRGLSLAQRAERKRLAGFGTQFRYFVDRSITQLSRDLIWFFTDLILVLVSGLFLGLVFSRSQYRPAMPAQIVNRSLSAFGPTPPPLLREFFDRPIDDPIISEASFSCMAIGMTGVTAALRVFGPEQIVYWREASAGMSTTAYFLAKNVAHMFFILLSPLLYLTPFLTFVSCRAPFPAYYRVLVVTQFATTGLGYVVSIVAPAGLSQLAGVVVVLVFTMFGGARPTLVEIQQMFPLLHVMPYLSYIRWAQEAMYLTEMSEWHQIKGVDIEPSLKLFDYHLEDFTLCMIVVLVFGVGFRVVALVAMLALHREQKH